jgi:hypothetical protein
VATSRTRKALLILPVLALTLTGCSKFTEPFKDAPRGASNTGPADTITMPDGFSNAATKCDHGNRIYVVYHADSAYGSIAVVPQDPTCGVGPK